MEKEITIAYQNLMLKKMIQECPKIPKQTLRKRLSSLGTIGKTAYIIYDFLNDNLDNNEKTEATHTEIGQMLSISRPNCAKALKILSQIGLITMKYKTITINKKMFLEEE